MSPARIELYPLILGAEIFKPKLYIQKANARAGSPCSKEKTMQSPARSPRGLTRLREQFLVTFDAGGKGQPAYSSRSKRESETHGGSPCIVALWGSRSGRRRETGACAATTKQPASRGACRPHPSRGASPDRGPPCCRPAAAGSLSRTLADGRHVTVSSSFQVALYLKLTPIISSRMRLPRQ